MRLFGHKHWLFILSSGTESRFWGGPLKPASFLTYCHESGRICRENWRKMNSKISPEVNTPAYTLRTTLTNPNNKSKSSFLLFRKAFFDFQFWSTFFKRADMRCVWMALLGQSVLEAENRYPRRYYRRNHVFLKVLSAHQKPNSPSTKRLSSRPCP